MAGVAAALAVVLTPLWVIVDDRVLNQSGDTSFIAAGLVPWVVLVMGVAAAYMTMRRAMRATRGEAVQSCFVFLVTAFAALTAIAVWFRGPGMALGWFASM